MFTVARAFSEIKMGKDCIFFIGILAATATVCLAVTSTTTTTTPVPTTTTLARTTTTYGGEVPEMTYMCASDGAGGIQLTVSVYDSLVTQRIVASDIRDNSFDFGDCASTMTTHDGTDIHSLVITFSTSGVQKDPIMSQKNCYVQVENDGTLSVQITYQRDPPRISVGDFVRRVNCDPDNLSDTELEVVNGGFQISPSDMYSKEEAVSETPVGVITLTLVNLHGGGVYMVGDLVKIRIRYDYNEAQNGPSPIALLMTNVVMYGSRYGPEDGIQYVSTNGCTTTGVNFRIITNDPITGVTIQESDAFRLPMFRLSQLAIITVKYAASCYTLASSRCDDQQAFCDFNGLQRKRRSTNTGQSVNGTMVVRIPVGVPELISDNNEGDQNVGDNSGLIQGTCGEVRASMYWILAVVLGSLLLVVIVVCLYLIYRLRFHLHKDRDVKIVETFEGNRNTGYY